MKCRFSFAVLIMAFSFFSATVHAARDRNFFSASRALAMGDAYTAYNVGYEAIYYNPAGVALRNKPRLKLVDIEVTGSQAMVLVFKDTFSDLLNFQGITSSMQNHPGKPITAGLSLLPQFIVKNFSVGLLLRGQSEGFIDETSADMTMSSFADIGAYMHYAAAFWGGIVKVGVGLKILSRAEVERVYTQAEYGGGLQFPNEWNEGTGIGADAGLLVTLPVTYLPTFAVVVQDFGNTQFRANKVFLASDSAPNVAPNDIKQKVNVGFAMKVRHGRGVASGLSTEVKDLLAATSDKSYLDRFHAGWELSVNESFYLRAGLNQGRYWTAGIGLGVEGVGLELATYGENISQVAGERFSDRKWVGRYVAQF
jgi:hypothetical protein